MIPQKRESDSLCPAPARKVPGRWVAGAAIAALLLGLILLFFLRPAHETGNAPSKESLAAPAFGKEGSLADPNDWQGPLPAEIARLFTTAQTHAQRLELIADPVKDGYWMERFFREGGGAKEKVSTLTPMGSVNTDRTSFERFQVSLEDGGNRLLCVIVSTRGAKVDFRSYARFCSESWEDLLSGRSKIAEEVRVFIEPGSAYLHEFSDDLKWSSYIATSPDTPEPLYFYAARDSETDMELAEMTGGTAMRATLAIRSTGESSRHRQFEITDVVAAGWVK